MTQKTQTVKQKEKKVIEPAADDFPVVGIGASVGGLQAFEEFFSAMPADSGLAFVLVSHLDPGQTSILPELIQKKTGMKVVQAVDHMKIAPNQVYIIPPNRNLAIFKGSLQLFELDKPRGTNMPIDSFLRSLAQDRGNGAIGIILSGTGTDGTLGIRAIKGEAGLVMVQDPETAGFDGMPRSAIASGLADYVLPPQRMPEKLREYVRHRLPAGEKSITDDEKLAGALRKIYLLLRTATDRDFSQYKRNTICRVHRDSHTLLSNKLDTLVSEKKPLTAMEVKWLRLDGEPVELVISAAPISFRKKDGALFFVREKL